MKRTREEPCVWDHLSAVNDILKKGDSVTIKDLLLHHKWDCFVKAVPGLEFDHFCIIFKCGDRKIGIKLRQFVLWIENKKKVYPLKLLLSQVYGIAIINIVTAFDICTEIFDPVKHDCLLTKNFLLFVNIQFDQKMKSLMEKIHETDPANKEDFLSLEAEFLTLVKDYFNKWRDV